MGIDCLQLVIADFCGLTEPVLLLTRDPPCRWLRFGRSNPPGIESPTRVRAVSLHSRSVSMQLYTISAGRLFAHDEDYMNEFTNDCNFILLSMKTAQEDVANVKWICSNSK